VYFEKGYCVRLLNNLTIKYEIRAIKIPASLSSSPNCFAKQVFVHYSARQVLIVSAADQGWSLEPQSHDRQ